VRLSQLVIFQAILGWCPGYSQVPGPYLKVWTEHDCLEGELKDKVMTKERHNDALVVPCASR